MRRTVIVYATLLLLTLGASYLSWTAEPDTTTEEGVVLLDVEAARIETIHYVSADLDVMLTAAEDERGRYLWAKLVKQQERKPEREKKPPKPPLDAAPAAETGGEEAGPTKAEPPVPTPEPPGEPVIETVQMEFAASAAGDKLLEHLAPLRAKRELESVGDDKLGELGLSGSPATLTIGIAGRDAVTYEIGESEFGGGNMYLREPSSGRIYVVDAQALGALTKADARLPNRTLFGAKLEEIVSARVDADGRGVVLEHRNRADAERQFWAVEGAEGGDETAQAWLQKFFRLRAVSYVPSDEQPSDPTLRFRVDVEDEKGVRTAVEILSGARPDGEPGWYGRSEHTRGLVELAPALAEETAQDIAAVLE